MTIKFDMKNPTFANAKFHGEVYLSKEFAGDPDKDSVAVDQEGVAWKWAVHDAGLPPHWWPIGPVVDQLIVYRAWAEHAEKRAEAAEAQLAAVYSLSEEVVEDAAELARWINEIRNGRLTGLPTQERYEEHCVAKGTKTC